jgi:hypothetical protein
MANTLAQRVLWVIWPAFLVAAVAELLFFAVFDPIDLHAFGAPLDADRVPIYTVGFFFFWGTSCVASALTVFLQRSPFEVNRCPLTADNRPAGCPKRTCDAMPD